MLKIAAYLITAMTFAVPALAQTSGTVQLKGSVAVACTVTVTDLGQTLNLTGGETNKIVGTITENCNGANGYGIGLASVNAGNLKSGANAVAYTVNYDSYSGGLAVPAVLGRSTAQFGKKVDLKVSLAGSAQYISGDYADTVVVVISAK